MTEKKNEPKVKIAFDAFEFTLTMKNAKQLITLLEAISEWHDC